MRGSAARVALPALALLGLTGVVVVASGGSTPTGTSASRQAPDVLLDSFISIGIVLLVPAAAMLLYALTQRKAISREIATKKLPRFGLAGWFGFVIIFTLITYFRGGDWQPPTIDDELGEQAFPGGSGRPTTPGVTGVEVYEPEFAWLPVLALVVLMALGAFAFLFATRRRGSGALDDAQIAHAIAEILDETLDDLRAEADPRRAVIAAFARLERTFAAQGLPRQRAETAHEYVSRVLLQLAVAERSVTRLADLFELAKFSDHDVDAGMKEEAIGALEDVRDRLRAQASADEALPELHVEAGRA
ncbi:MAG: DUF4129 domain-containing protein [Gaiellaceae bacterium]